MSSQEYYMTVLIAGFIPVLYYVYVFKSPFYPLSSKKTLIGLQSSA